MWGGGGSGSAVLRRSGRRGGEWECCVRQDWAVGAVDKRVILACGRGVPGPRAAGGRTSGARLGACVSVLALCVAGWLQELLVFRKRSSAVGLLGHCKTSLAPLLLVVLAPWPWFHRLPRPCRHLHLWRRRLWPAAAGRLQLHDVRRVGGDVVLVLTQQWAGTGPGCWGTGGACPSRLPPILATLLACVCLFACRRRVRLCVLGDRPGRIVSCAACLGAGGFLGGVGKGWWCGHRACRCCMGGRVSVSVWHSACAFRQRG